MLARFLFLVAHVDELHASLLVDGLLHLGHELLEKLDLLGHGGKVGRVAVEFQFAAALGHLHLLGFLGQFVLHGGHLAAVNLLHLLVLVLDYRYVFFLVARLLAELLRVFLRALLVLLFDFVLLRARFVGAVSDLLTEASVLEPDGLGLLLKFALLSLKLGSQLDVVSDNLVVEDLLLLQLGHHAFNVLRGCQVALSLLLFETGSLVSHSVQHALVVGPLL